MTARRLFWAAWALAMLFALLLAQAIRRERRDTGRLYQAAVAQGQGHAREAARKVAATLATLEPVVHGLVADLESGKLAPGAVSQRLQADLRQGLPQVERLGVLFRPYAAGNSARLFAPYAIRQGGAVKTLGYETWADYTTRPWFRFDQARGWWSNPEWSHDNAYLLVNYLEPFRLPGSDQPSGLVRMEVPLAGIQALAHQLSEGFSGYVFLLSPTTAYIADPRPELIHAGKTLAGVAEQTHDPARKWLAECALKGQPGMAETVSGATGQRALSFLEPIPSVHWSAGVNLFRDELTLVPPDYKQQVLGITTCAIALAWMLLFLAFRGWNLAPRNLWWVVALGSASVVAGMGVLFHATYTTPAAQHPDEIRVMNARDLERFKAEHGSQQKGLERIGSQFIPTGVYLQTLEITGPSQVKLTGMIWQRLPKGTPREKRGLILPEALTGDISLGPEHEEGDSVIQYYPFKVTVEPELDDSSVYPFDRIRARLRLWPKAWYSSDALEPDLRAYPVLAFGAFPGMDPEADVPGWHMEGNEFAYVLENYSTDFGNPDFVGMRQSAELVWNVQLQRDFLGPFIVAFLPLIAVAGLLFALLLTVSQAQAAVKATGYGYLNLLRTTIALFFSLVVAQFNIRNRIVASGVIHLEWYYFIMYGAILVVSVDALIFAFTGDRPLRAHDNLVAKLAFWPLLLGGFYLVSAMFVL